MKTIQNTIVIVLLFIANAVAAQSFTKMSAQQAHLAGSGISAQAPSSLVTPYSNPILNRKITVNPNQYAVGTRQAVNAVAPVSPRKVGGTLPVKPTNTLPGHWIGSDAKTELPNVNAGVGSGLGIFDQETVKNNGGLVEESDYRPGELAPIGDALIPFLIMLLIYVLFLLVRGDARDEQELA